MNPALTHGLQQSHAACSDLCKLTSGVSLHTVLSLQATKSRTHTLQALSAGKDIGSLWEQFPTGSHTNGGCSQENYSRNLLQLVDN